MTELTENSTALSTENYVRHSMAIMQKWGNGEVFDKKLFVDRGKHCQQAMTGQMLEFGRVLIILKEHLAHGEFTETVQTEFGITRSTASRFMQATIKFCGDGLQDTTPKLVQLGKSKLLELMAQDDDDLKELAEGGTIANLTLDEVDRMSVQELRKALRNARADREAQGKLIADKDNKINELATKLTKKEKLIKEVTPDQEAEALRKETTNIAFGAEATLRGTLHQAFSELAVNSEKSRIDHKQFMVGLLGQIESTLNQLRNEFDLPNIADSEDLEPWLRDDYDEEAVLANAQANLVD
ncbi:hypothetical protein A6B39_10600 [Mannheimia granulomatis]|uniref:DUF3102 domain-containing protein n=1 Tax=Mannheimia granulomatis TaxID=85402 RepID=UPI00159D82BF|nr:DUF3102 domain-containing protein [Mannheimia granulomatis]QLB15865.1 hypothetical protein A6B39_10600 [Mannheimia granulomatis]